MSNIKEPFVKVLLGIIMAHKERANAGGIALLYVLEKENTLALSILNKMSTSIRQESSTCSKSKTFAYQETFTWGENLQAAAGSNTSYNAMINPNPMSLVHEWPEPPVHGETHWVIPGRILVGASPSGMTKSGITAIVNSGIDTFVSLQTKYLEYTREDYRNVLRNISSLSKGMFPPHKLRFLHCPIGDHDTLLDNKMVDFIEELSKILEVDNGNVYIHCFGGHGRTGLVLVNLLQYFFGIDKSSAMQALRNSHKKRKCGYGGWCSFERGQLEDSSQESQVIRLEHIMFHRQLEIRRLQKLIHTNTFSS